MSNKRDRLRASAQRNLQRGQIEKAIKDYTKIVEDDPDDIRTMLKIGDLQTRCGNFSEATAAYKQVASHYEDDGFHLKAVAVYKQVLKIDNSLKPIHQKLAELYAELGLISDACVQYEQLALIHEAAQDYEESIECLNKILEIDPANVPVRLKLAELMVQAMQVTHATAHFMKAAEKLQEQGKLEDANKVFERAYDLNPENLNAALASAEIYLQQGEAKRALAKLQPCFDKNTKDIKTLSLMGESFSALKANRKATLVYEALAHIHRDTGDRNQYIQTLEKLIELDPENTQAQNVFTNIDRYWPKSASSTKREQAKSSSPEQSSEEMITTLFDEIAVFQEFGLHDKIVEYLKKVLSIQPGNAKAKQMLEEIEPDSVIDIDDNVELIEDIATGPKLKTAQFKAFILEDDGLAEQSAEALEIQLEEKPNHSPSSEDQDNITIAYETQINDSEIHDALKGLALDDTDSEYFVSEVFAKFKAGVDKEVGSEDIQTHYDLGIAYMEMGLFKDAIREFGYCLNKEGMHVNGLIMQSMCYRNLMLFADAEKVLEDAMQLENLSPEQEVTIFYEQGLTRENAGNREAAIEAYRLAVQVQPDFRDAEARAQRLESLDEVETN